jgi:acyl-CoA hydrolase
LLIFALMTMDMRPPMPATMASCESRDSRSGDGIPRPMEPRPVAHSLSVLVHWLGPTDLNSAGYVHGGVVMKLCDQVAGLAGVRHSGGRVVTAGMDRMTFNEPIEIGELLTLRAAVNAVWRTSMEIGVRVEAERPASGSVRHTNSAYLTMVAVDDAGRPREVPQLQVEGEVEQRRERAAQTRRRNRLAERDEIV